MKGSQISYLWKNPDAARSFNTGVSLHSHTNRSRETLDFVVKVLASDGFFGRLFQRLEVMHARHSVVKLDYARAWWTPPLTPRLAFDLERRQIENRLNRPALVSITDHDNIEAPQLLRTVASARHIPVSVEWTTPFGADQCFHLGIHNLPSAQGAQWMQTFQEFTANPSDAPPDRTAERAPCAAQCPHHLQPPHVGSLRDRLRPPCTARRRFHATERPLHPCAWS